ITASGWGWSRFRRCCCTRPWPSGSPGARRGCPAWRGGRCAPTCGSSAAGWCRSCIRPRLDRIVEGAYAATVEVDGPQGVGLVDARSSDALNLAVLTDAPVFVSPEMLADCIGRQEGDSAEAVLLQRAIAGHPMAVRRADP